MANKYKEISISGLSTSPSDLQADDGNLAIAGNSIHFDGTIRRFIHPKSLVSSSQYTGQESDGMYNITAVYQHANDNYQHIIYRFLRVDRGQQIVSYGWSTFDDTSRIYEFADGRSPILGNIDIHSYASVGNTLIMYTDDQPYYFLFKNGSYTFLGNRIPDLEISFSLQPHTYMRNYDNEGSSSSSEPSSGSWNYDIGNRVDLESAITYGDKDPNSHDDDYDIDCYKFQSDDIVTNLSNISLAMANKFVANWCDKNGYFSQPFLARAAFRMYDGSTSMSTAPVLMRPVTTVNPVINIDALWNSTMYLGCFGIGCKLCYHIANTREQLDQWSDIINGIEIFVSRPFYTYKQDTSVTSVCIPKHSNWGSSQNFKTIPNDVWPHLSVCGANSDNQLGDRATDMWSAAKDVWNHADKLLMSAPGTISSQEHRIFDKDGNVIAGYVGQDSAQVAYYNGGFKMLAAENPVQAFHPTAFVLMPKVSSSTLRDQIRDCSNFYLIKSLKFDDINFSGNRSSINLDEGVINSIATREQFQEDYRSHDTLVPSATFSYNNRLNITNVKRYPYAGYSPYSMFQRTCGSMAHFSLSTVVYLRNSTGNVVVRREDVGSSNFQSIIDTDFKGIINYAYYPDSTAYQMDIILSRTDVSHVWKATIPLTIHNGLNGSVFFDGLEANIQFSAIDYPNAEAYFDSLSERANGTYTIESSTVYTSDDSNPFVFRAANVEQVGNGQIIAMAPAVQALSAGQFGQYPMYCFTTEGIWALTVSDTGGWQSKQPISRDVALAASTILQTDQSVIFATARGLMQITGSTVTYISDIFDGQPDVFTRRCTTHLNEIFHQQSGLVDGMPSFRDYLQGCNMHYAYRNQRIYIGNPDYQHAFVFSMKDRLWTTVPLCITSAINSYPDALAMIDNLDQTTSLVNLIIDDPTATDPDAAVFGCDPAASPAAILGRDAAGTSPYTTPRAATTPICLLTRPINFDDPHGLKTLITTQVRGMFDPTHITIHLYATRDLVNWLEIARVIGPRISLRHGAPYRAFRLAIIADLTPDEYLTTITAEYEPKLYNKLR